MGSDLIFAPDPGMPKGSPNAFKAQGRPIGHVAIWNWKQAGWSRVTAKNAVAKATRAIETKATAVPAHTSNRPTPAEAQHKWGRS